MFEKILLAVDGSSHSSGALKAATELARIADGEVRVVHVREFGFGGRTGDVELEGSEAAHQIVDDALGALREAGVRASGTVRGARHGHEAREILDEAIAAGSQTIVMGSRGHGELEGILVGSTAQKVLHLGTFPVLVVR